MAVLDPILVELRGVAGSVVSPKDIAVPDFPFDLSRGLHTVTIEDKVYIDRNDFRVEDSEVR